MRGPEFTDLGIGMVVSADFAIAFQRILCYILVHFLRIHGKMCLKAPLYYSAPFRSYNFSICLWENPKTLIVIISELWDVSLAPQTNYCYLWRHQDTSKNQRQTQTHFWEIFILQISRLRESFFEISKRGAPNNPTIRRINY